MSEREKAIKVIHNTKEARLFENGTKAKVVSNYLNK